MKLPIEYIETNQDLQIKHQQALAIRNIKILLTLALVLLAAFVLIMAV